MSFAKPHLRSPNELDTPIFEILDEAQGLFTNRMIHDDNEIGYRKS